MNGRQFAELVTYHAEVIRFIEKPGQGYMEAVLLEDRDTGSIMRLVSVIQKDKTCMVRIEGLAFDFSYSRRWTLENLERFAAALATATRIKREYDAVA